MLYSRVDEMSVITVMDIKELKNFISQGCSAYQVSKKLKCSASTVVYWIEKHGLQEEYNSYKHSRLHTGDNRGIRSVDKELLQSLFDECASFREVIKKLGYNSMSGSLHKTLKTKVKEEGINLTVFNLNNERRKKTQLLGLSRSFKTENSEIFLKNSKKCSSLAKRRIIQENLIEYKCQNCQNDGTYFGRPLTLQLDHINGENKDHRLENLRFLCPNCHSQTETWGTKANGVIRKCEKCNVRVSKLSRLCRTCNNKLLCRKMNPVKLLASIEEIIEEVRKTNYVVAGEKFGVSDNALRKRLRKAGIDPKTVKKEKIS